MHEAEKYAPNHETEAGESRHSRGFEVAGRVLRLELAALLERAAVEQFAEAAATRRGLHDGVKGTQPCGEFHRLRPEHRFQHLGDVIEIDVGIFQAGGGAERKILDEQEVALVAIARRLYGLAHVMEEKMAQRDLVGERRGLQKLTELVHLDLRVHLLKPGLGQFNRLGRRREFLVDRAGVNFNDKFAHQRGVNGLQGTERGSLIFERRLSGCSHDFTIQLGTCLRKRTATTVRSE